MEIDVFTSQGEKQGTRQLPSELFGHPVNEGLIHQFIVLQMSNRRQNIADTKTRGEIRGSTKKLFKQKGTGRARRGSIRANILRGGNKSFGPVNNRNFIKNMPRQMRRAALLSGLSYQALKGLMIELKTCPEVKKTKEAQAVMNKLPLEKRNKTLFVLPGKNIAFSNSVRNIPGVKTILFNYLNPEDVLKHKTIVFIGKAIDEANKIFGKEVKKPVIRETTTRTKEEKPEIKTRSYKVKTVVKKTEKPVRKKVSRKAKIPAEKTAAGKRTSKNSVSSKTK